MILKSLKKGFTLVEMLLVIAIISILAAMAISNFSNASQDTRDIVSRQQLAVVQEAVNHYVNREIGRVTTSGGPGKTVAQVMAAYNLGITDSGTVGTGTAKDRFNVFKRYLDEATLANLTVDTANSRVTSQAMRDVSKYLTLPTWEAASYPKVQLNP